MSDFGPASGNGELSVGSSTVAIVFQEVHTANNIQSPTTAGIPGGIATGASANNNLGPGDFSGSSAQAYGTVSNGNAVTPQFVNFSNTLVPNVLFRFKNPA